MSEHSTRDVSIKTIPVPLSVGDRVKLYNRTKITDGGEKKEILFFDGVVEQYVPETGLLSFDLSDIGRARFLERLEEADKIIIESR